MNPHNNHYIQMGMWHRPFEKDLNEVNQTLQELKELGINELFVESYFNGQLIYPSRVCSLSMHKFVGDYEKYGQNLLLAFVEQGKIYGVKIHAWVENFFVGQYQDVTDSFWYQYRKDWILMNRDYTYLQNNEKNYLFLDPANTEVRKYTLNIYKEMIEIKGLASLHLDYIRYPLVYKVTPPDLSDDVGYTKVSLDGFKKYANIEENVYERLLDPLVYEQWSSYKIDIINSFVEEVYQLTSNDQLDISIAIFGDPNHAKVHKMQDWYSWVKKEMIDLIIPMAYYQSHKRVYDEVFRLNELIGNQAKVYAGIAPAFMKLDVEEHQSQLISSTDAKAEGIVMFATQNYLTKHFMGESKDHDQVQDMLKKWKGNQPQ